MSDIISIPEGKYQNARKIHWSHIIFAEQINELGVNT